MEKAWQIGIWVAAFCLALILLSIGYKKITQPKTKIKWVRDLSIAVTAIIALFYFSYEKGKYATTCYDMLKPPDIISQEDLTQQLPLLEKAYKENKINDQSYLKALGKIKIDLEILGNAKKEYKKELNLTDEEIEALKKKVQELIEKTENK